MSGSYLFYLDDPDVQLLISQTKFTLLEVCEQRDLFNRIHLRYFREGKETRSTREILQYLNKEIRELEREIKLARRILDERKNSSNKKAGRSVRFILEKGERPER
jgi:hypothetical protein